MNDRDLSDRLLDFAVGVGKLVEIVPKSLLGKQIASQYGTEWYGAGPELRRSVRIRKQKRFRT